MTRPVMRITMVCAPDQTATTMNFARRMLERGTGTASMSLRVPSANSRPNTQLMIRQNKKKPPAAIIMANKPR